MHRENNGVTSVMYASVSGSAPAYMLVYVAGNNNLLGAARGVMCNGRVSLLSSAC